MVCDFAHLLCTVLFEKGRCAATYKLFICVDICFLSLLVLKKEQKRCFKDFGDMQEFCVVWFFVTISITISTSVSLLLLSSMFLIILQYIWMMSSLVYGLDICVQGGDVRVSTGRCFIFVMNYIKLTYIGAGIMFISYVVVECLYFIHWKRCTNVGRGWNIRGRKGCQCLLLQSCKEGDKVAQTWQLHSEWP